MKVAHAGSDSTRRQRWLIAALGTPDADSEQSTVQDGDATAAHGAGAPMMRRLATVLFAALALFAFQLVHAQTSSAATGVACGQTGMETVASDAADYPPGSTAHFPGTGYAPDCDVQLNVSRPDGVTDTLTATTDLLGNFSADYALPPPPGVIW